MKIVRGLSSIMGQREELSNSRFTKLISSYCLRIASGVLKKNVRNGEESCSSL